jgi:hypothetical protein
MCPGYLLPLETGIGGILGTSYKEEKEKKLKALRCNYCTI